MDDPRRLWTDERISDRFAAIESKLGGDIEGLSDDVAEVKALLQSLISKLETTEATLRKQELKHAEAKIEERKKLDEERKSDRRWLIGTVLTVLALIVAAMSILSGAGAFS